MPSTWRARADGKSVLELGDALGAVVRLSKAIEDKGLLQGRFESIVGSFGVSNAWTLKSAL